MPSANTKTAETAQDQLDRICLEAFEIANFCRKRQGTCCDGDVTYSRLANDLDLVYDSLQAQSTIQSHRYNVMIFNKPIYTILDRHSELTCLVDDLADLAKSVKHIYARVLMGQTWGFAFDELNMRNIAFIHKQPLEAQICMILNLIHHITRRCERIFNYIGYYIRIYRELTSELPLIRLPLASRLAIHGMEIIYTLDTSSIPVDILDIAINPIPGAPVPYNGKSCPFCSDVINFSNQEQLRRHILRDLKVYVPFNRMFDSYKHCVHNNFAAEHQWCAHEDYILANKHCNNFVLPDLWGSQCQATHEQSIYEGKNSECPFGKDCRLLNQVHERVHIPQHMEDIAISAIRTYITLKGRSMTPSSTIDSVKSDHTGAQVIYSPTESSLYKKAQETREKIHEKKSRIRQWTKVHFHHHRDHNMGIESLMVAPSMAIAALSSSNEDAQTLSGLGNYTYTQDLIRDTPVKTNYTASGIQVEPRLSSFSSSTHMPRRSEPEHDCIVLSHKPHSHRVSLQKETSQDITDHDFHTEKVKDSQIPSSNYPMHGSLTQTRSILHIAISDSTKSNSDHHKNRKSVHFVDLGNESSPDSGVKLDECKVTEAECNESDRPNSSNDEQPIQGIKRTHVLCKNDEASKPNRHQKRSSRKRKSSQKIISNPKGFTSRLVDNSNKPTIPPRRITNWSDKFSQEKNRPSGTQRHDSGFSDDGIGHCLKDFGTRQLRPRLSSPYLSAKKSPQRV